MRKILKAIFFTIIKPKLIIIFLKVYIIDSFLYNLVKYIAPFLRLKKKIIFNIYFYLNLIKVEKIINDLNQKKIINNNLNNQLEKLIINKTSLLRLNSLIKNNNSIVLGEIDKNSFFSSENYRLNGFVNINLKKKTPRSRSKIEVIANISGVFVRKNFLGRDSKKRFVQELLLYNKLNQAKVNAPKILNANLSRLSLTIEFIGPDLETFFYKKGINLNSKSINDKFKNKISTYNERMSEYITRGRQGLRFFDKNFINSISNQLKSFHRLGIRLYDIKYGNIAVHYSTGKAYFIDFDSADIFKPKSLFFLIERDRDIKKFNKMFNSKLITYDTLKERIKNLDFPGSNILYSPFYIGSGLKIGRIWDISVGFGRWHFIVKNFIKLNSRSKLASLGANNASLELLMLRSGLRKIIAYEKNKKFISQGKFLLEAISWYDNKNYNLKYINKDMMSFTKEKKKFDIVILLCSIYYLSENSINKLIEVIKSKTDTIYLQCNHSRNIGRGNKNDYKRATLNFAKKILLKHGFFNIKVKTPTTYSRPMIKGTVKK